MGRATFAVGAAVCWAAACGDGQMGAGYEGEPLLAMRGIVKTSALELSAEYVPALVTWPDKADSGSGKPWREDYIRGEVEGMFPNAFTLRVYEPPPEDRLEVIADGEPRMAVALIVVISPEHPKQLTKTASPVGDISDNRTLVRMCDENGQCMEGDTGTCWDGDPPPWPCGNALPEGHPWATYGSPEHHSVVYFEAPVPAGGVLAKLYNDGKPIPAGYHVVKYVAADWATTLTEEQRQRNEACRQAAVQREVAEFMRIHGPPTTDPASIREYHKYVMRGYAESGCPWVEHLIPDGERIELTLIEGVAFL
jgi:hypothetical protein